MMISTLQWFPAHIQRIKEYIRMTVGVDSELYKVWDEVDLITQNMYLSTMDANTCLRWENFLGIVASPLDTLDDRRSRIKGYFASNLPYTEKKMNEVLTAMCGADGYELVIDPHEGSVNVMIKLNNVRLVDNSYDVIRRMAPADMGVNARIVYNEHGIFRAFTHGSLEAYTHYQLRNDPIFMQDRNRQITLTRYTHEQLSAYTHLQLLEEDL